MIEPQIISYAVTDKLRIYDRGILVAEFSPVMFPAMIEKLAFALFGKVHE